VDLGPFGAITSLVVERQGELVTEQYESGDRDTLRNTRSCTKTVLSMLVGIAIERGVVSLDTAIAGRATVRELLTMSSGLDCDDWDERSPGNEELMYPTDDWAAFARSLPERVERTFSYCTAGVVLLGVELERLLGEALPAFASRELFRPLGIERFEWPQTPKGESSCAGGLLLRSRDLLALGRVALDPDEWTRLATSPQARIDEHIDYGFLWWMREIAGERTVYMTGMGGNRVHVFPESETVVVVTSQNFLRRDAHALSDALVAQVVSSPTI
jgi:CubicO group peptidase (beta-lactamase class C family)